MDGITPHGRLDHFALRFRRLLLRQYLGRLRHLCLGRLRLLRERGDRPQFDAIGVRLALALDLQAPGVFGSSCRLVTLRRQQGHLMCQPFSSREGVADVGEAVGGGEAGEGAESLDVAVQAAIVEMALESITEQGGQGLTLAYAVEQPLGAMDPFGRQVDGKGEAPDARVDSCER